MNKTLYTENIFDVIIIGAGGSGMQVALHLSNLDIKVALISKVFPTRSHTSSAQGGISVALGNAGKDNWKWHMYDTIKGGDYLGDHDSIEFFCKNGPEAVYELEHMGVPFSRMKNGKIYQRPFGGQTKYFGKEQASRTCSVSDRTGHALLHTLYQQNVKVKTTIFSEWYALDFVKSAQGRIVGITAICIETGEISFFNSRICIIATGGAGRIYESTTNAYINTGDGFGMLLRAGYPLQDMEMWQFHPTGIAGSGILITEGCRGEGGYLINNKNERFMEKYAPNMKDLASRDVISRAIFFEIKSGNGFHYYQHDCVKLRISHLGSEIIQSRLPGIRELSITFANIDPIFDDIPVFPTCHYIMGGIPTNIYGQVLTKENNQETIVEGLYAIGECACVSIHGANRLGGNSLLDLIVFGRSAGKHIEHLWKSHLFPEFTSISKENIYHSLERYFRWENSKSGEDSRFIYKEMKKIMQENFGVFRTEKYMKEGLKKLKFLRNQLNNAYLADKSKCFNTDRIFALELDNLMATAYATAKSALCRQESRGAHNREDYPDRNDLHWMKHILYFDNNEYIDFRPVNISSKESSIFMPKERIY